MKGNTTTASRSGSKGRSTTDVPSEAGLPSMSRKYSPDNSRCLVTLRLPREAAPDATRASVAGTFNDWSPERHPMKRLKNGGFVLELELKAGREYEFRFVIDGVRWENASNADKYVWSDYAGCENSVIVT